jgi:hypothetical protein
VHPLRQTVAVASKPGQHSFASQISELAFEAVAILATDAQDANQLT